VLYVVSCRVTGALQVPDPTGDHHAFHLVAPPSRSSTRNRSESASSARNSRGTRGPIKSSTST
jgi:hypothetical protein